MIFRQLCDLTSSAYTYLLGDPASGEAILIEEQAVVQIGWCMGLAQRVIDAALAVREAVVDRQHEARRQLP